MTSRDFHTLLVRVETSDAKKLKLIAAYDETSMSELVRQALADIIKEKERKKVYRELLSV